MKRKIVLAVAVLGLVMGALLVSARPSHAIPTFWHLGVPVYGQETGCWCWAASLKSIMDYLGPWVSQCQIVKVGWGWYYAPYQPQCQGWEFGWPDWIPQSVLSTYGFSSTVTGQISFNSIMHELYYGNQPIYVRVMYSPISGHAFVLCGYDASGAQYVERMDPGWGGGYHISTYDWLDSGGQSWDATIYHIHN